MKKICALILAFVTVMTVVPYARSLGAPSAPAGVSANDWIPLGDAAGFVISHGTDDHMPGGAQEKPGTVKGYFMVRRASAWLRVDSAAPYDVQKALWVP